MRQRRTRRLLEDHTEVPHPSPPSQPVNRRRGRIPPIRIHHGAEINRGHGLTLVGQRIARSLASLKIRQKPHCLDHKEHHTRFHRHPMSSANLVELLSWTPRLQRRVDQALGVYHTMQASIVPALERHPSRNRSLANALQPLLRVHVATTRVQASTRSRTTRLDKSKLCMGMIKIMELKGQATISVIVPQINLKIDRRMIPGPSNPQIPADPTILSFIAHHSMPQVMTSEYRASILLLQHRTPTWTLVLGHALIMPGRTMRNFSLFATQNSLYLEFYSSLQGKLSVHIAWWRSSKCEALSLHRRRCGSTRTLLLQIVK